MFHMPLLRGRIAHRVAMAANQRCTGVPDSRSWYVYWSQLRVPIVSPLPLLSKTLSNRFEIENKKTLTLTGARGKRSSRYHPGLLTSRGANLYECLSNVCISLHSSL